MDSTMRMPNTSALQLLDELPGIADVVWATITRLASARVPTSVLFTAAETGAGTSVLASATAIGLAQHQRVPVCLLETNIRRPALASYFGLESAGLSDVLDGRAELEDCLQEPRNCPGLLVLPAGTPRMPVPGELTTDRMASVLARLEQRGHYLLLDSAPVLDHVESRLLLRHVDAVLLVLRARVTRRRDAERAYDILLESRTPVFGSIFNDYRSEGLFGGVGRGTRALERSMHTERPGPAAATPIARGDLAPVTNGGPHPTNGGAAIDGLVTPANGSEAAHRRELDILERRIAKLTHLLEQTEADLRRISSMKDVDLGIASIYRSVQGLSSEEEALAFKRSLMKAIFQANLELKTAMARHP